MKTTLEIPDALFREAKTRAAASGITLKQLFTEAIQGRLNQKPSTRQKEDPAWMAGFGELSDLKREHQRVLQTIEAEFEQIEPEDLK